jgi:hypothetical protein
MAGDEMPEQVDFQGGERGKYYVARGDLFKWGEVTLHSGDRAAWIIDCLALTNGDLDCLARIYASRHAYGTVRGIPTGGLRFASALRRYATKGPLLVADDVCTTGASFETVRLGLSEADRWRVQGVCIFARGTLPMWVDGLFRLSVATR